MGRQVICLVIGLLCAVSSLPAQTVQFSARQDIQTNARHLTGLVVADFNGDGKLDIAVTDDYSQTVSVYLNDGTGKFGTPVKSTFSVPSIGGFGALVAGDVNEDGKQDLIVGPIAGLQYDVVLLGNGDGTFTEKGQIAGSYGFEGASLVDINGDKHLDLVAGGNGSLYVHLGDGKGNFTQQPLPMSGPSDLFNSVTTGDFNGDGKIDFVATMFMNSSLIYYPGNADGTFQTPTMFTGTAPAYTIKPESIACADFNGDGKLDLLVGAEDIAWVIFGNGDGTFQTASAQMGALSLPAPINTNPSLNIAPTVATADMNRDGKMDAVVADNGSDTINVFLNDGTGKFLQANFSTALDDGTGVVQLADLNGDGLPDIVLTNYKTQKISVFLSAIPKTTPTISIQSSAAQALVGSSVTITVQVMPAGLHMPTGSVTLSSGSTSYGQQALSSSGQATFTLPSLATGQYSLTASYSGDTYNNSASNATAFTQDSTDFQASITTPTQTVAAGSSATYVISLSPLSGFTGSINLTCSGLPAGYVCSSQPATMSAQAITAAVVVSPPATTAQLPSDSSRPFGSGPVTLFAAAGMFWLCRRKRIAIPVLCAAAFLAMISLSGCSGSSAAKPPPYTGTSNFIITASATQSLVTVSHQVNATLVVQ